MITSTQIAQIRKTDNLEELLKQWETDLFFKELNKGKIALTITNQRDDKIETVAATPIGKSFAMHKNVFGMKNYKLTHINSKLSFISLTNKLMKEFIKELTEYAWFNEYDTFMENFKEGDNLNYAPHIDEIKVLYRKYSLK